MTLTAPPATTRNGYLPAPDVTSRRAAALCSWCARHRYELAPAAGNTAVLGLAWAEYATGTGWGTGLAYTAGTVLSAALSGFALKHKHQALATAGAAATATLADIGINAMAGPSTVGLVAAAITTIGSYIIYVPWLTKRRHERLALHVQAAKAGTGSHAGMGLAPNVAGIVGGSTEETAIYRGLAALGATPLSIDAFRTTATGWTALVTLPPGKTTSPAAVMAKREQLRTNMGLPGRLRLAQGPHGNQLLVRMETVDPLAEVFPWPGPSIRSIKEPIELGPAADGGTTQVVLLYSHTLVGGATDNGKSSLLRVLLGNIAAAEDAEMLLVDMKPGAVELGPWRRAAMAFADTPDKALAQLKWLRAEIDRRGPILEAEGTDKWDPAVHGPALFCVIDELAELILQCPKAVDLLRSIKMLGRFVAVHMVEATQSPSRRVFGGDTDARQQYQIRIGLGAAETTTINLIFGPGAVGNGWRLDELNLPGKFMIASRQHPEPGENRAYFMTRDQIDAIVDQYARDEHTDLDPTPPTGGGPGRPRFLKSVPCFPDGTQIPPNRLPLWKALDQRGADGASIVDLLADGLPGLNSRTAISDPIQVWKARGYVVEVGTRPDRSKVFATARHVQAA